MFILKLLFLFFLLITPRIPNLLQKGKKPVHGWREREDISAQ